MRFHIIPYNLNNKVMKGTAFHFLTGGGGQSIYPSIYVLRTGIEVIAQDLPGFKILSTDT